MTLREYLHKIRSQLASVRSSPSAACTSKGIGKSDVELVDITGSSFLLHNIEMETNPSEDQPDSSRLTSLGIRGRGSRYTKITPKNKNQEDTVNQKNVVSCTSEEDSSPVTKGVYSGTTSSAEGEMPRHDVLENAPLRGTNSSEWTQDPGRFITVNNLRHKRNLKFILSASLISLAIMILLGVTAIALHSAYSTPTVPSGNQTSLGKSEMDSNTRQWILPVQETMSAILRRRQSTFNNSLPLPYLTDLLGDNKAESTPVQPTPIIIPIPLLFKSANDSELTNAVIAANDALKVREFVEGDLLKKGHIPSKQNMVAYEQYFGRTSSKAKHLELLGFKTEKAYKTISTRMKLSRDDILNGSLRLNVNSSISKEFCEPQPVIKCNETAIYRTLDGSCNNLRHTSWGSSYEPFLRILHPDYADEISQPRSSAKDGSLLPTPKEISVKVHLDKYSADSKATLLLPLWGQFVSHDMILIAASTGNNREKVSCCDHDLPLDLQHPECIPLMYRSHADKQQCISLMRSAPFPNCDLGPRKQFNEVSSFLDASNVYGSTDSEFKPESLRMKRHGRLNVFRSPGKKVLLPAVIDPNDNCNNEKEITQKHYCFKAGDSRANVETSVTSMYTTWMRQHNEIAENLNLLNRHWDDEKLFQESRRILTAQIQHITYNEFLPAILGHEIMEKSGLQLLKEDYYQVYDTNVNPTISNVFATAAFQFGQSMQQGLVQMIGPMGINQDFIRLQKLMGNPFLLWTEGKMDSLIRGISNTPAAKVDAYFTNQLSQWVSSGVNSSEELDLIAINIQRGRDHGLPPYTAWRKICGLTPVDNFTQVDKEWDEGASLLISKVYKSVNDVDVFTGLLAEKPVAGALVGPTLVCLLTDQFLRLKKADRFWYEGDIQVQPFSPDQLQMIRQTTLARVLCNNGDNLKETQMMPMLQISQSNPIVNCDGVDIPRINYGSWREYPLNSGNHSKSATDSIEDYYEYSVENTQAKSVHVNQSNGNVTNVTTNHLQLRNPDDDHIKLIHKGDGEVLIQWPTSNSSLG